MHLGNFQMGNHVLPRKQFVNKRFQLEVSLVGERRSQNFATTQYQQKINKTELS